MWHVERATVGQKQRKWFKANACELYPLREAVVFDFIVCDLPFGQKFGENESAVTEDLPKILRNMNSFLKSNGKVVLLISRKLSSTLEKVSTEVCPTWKILGKYGIRLGELDAVLIKFCKNND